MKYLLALPALAAAWPGMGGQNRAVVGDDGDSFVGPSCTVGAHNWHPEVGECPPPQPSGALLAGTTELPQGGGHEWPASFQVDWTFYFMDTDLSPPYDTTPPVGPADYNATTGRTLYDSTYASDGSASMVEVYDDYCIPIFFEDIWAEDNAWGCEFLNVGNTTAFLLPDLDEAPEGSPECCIIGEPYHAPPRDFAAAMPSHSAWVDPAGVAVDWASLTLPDAGLFTYGFEAETSAPYQFVMMGSPLVRSTWMQQVFENFRADAVPPKSTWAIPEACQKAAVCPGWG